MSRTLHPYRTRDDGSVVYLSDRQALPPEIQATYRAAIMDIRATLRDKLPCSECGQAGCRANCDAVEPSGLIAELLYLAETYSDHERATTATEDLWAWACTECRQRGLDDHPSYFPIAR